MVEAAREIVFLCVLLLLPVEVQAIYLHPPFALLCFSLCVLCAPSVSSSEAGGEVFGYLAVRICLEKSNSQRRAMPGSRGRGIENQASSQTARSSASSVRSTAGSEPSNWSGRLAPTMAHVTPGC